MDFLFATLLIQMAATLQVHRELLCKLLDGNDAILQGKPPHKYLDDLMKEQTNKSLSGMADFSQTAATLFANVLLPKKKNEQDEPPSDESKQGS